MVEPSEQSVAFAQRKQFDLLRPCRRVEVRPIQSAEIGEAARFAADLLPELELNDLSVIERVVRTDPEMIQIFVSSGRLVGLYAMLFLTQSGLRSLLSGRFDARRPRTGHIIQPADKPAAIYTWFVACPGRASSGIGNIAQALQCDRFARADLYARPASAAGLRIMLATGHRPVSSDRDGLYKYTRICNREQLENAA